MTTSERPAVADAPRTDAELAALAAAGDADALAALFHRHGQRAFGAAYRLAGSPAEAQEVVQDLFVGLPEALRGWRGEGSLEAWIARIAVRLALMRLRAARRRESDVPADVLDARAPSAARVLDRIALDQAIAALPDDLRTVFVLREVEGYSHLEIAALLGIRRNTSEVRLFRARQALRELLRESEP